MRTRRNLLGLAALVAFEVVAVVALHRLGALPWLAVPLGDLSGWLAVTGVEDAIVAVLRLVALGCAYWLLASTLLYTLARLSRVPVAIRATRWVTLPGVRRVADRAVAVALLTSSVAGGAHPALAAAHAGVDRAALAAVEAAEPMGPPAVAGPEVLPGPPTVPPPRDAAGAPAPEGRPPDRGAAAEAPPNEASPDAPSPPSAPPPDRAAPRGQPDAADGPAADLETVHTVVAGDNLWSIVADHLAAATGGAPSDDDIRGVWFDVIEANRSTLRSGDPDLIYPGEQIRLPPPSAGGEERGPG